MTERSPDFAPRWASPPGETIRDTLVERGLALEVFAESIGLPGPRLQGLLSGSETISIELARRISSSIGGSVEFWLTRDGHYRDDLARVEADRWAQSLPISQMAEFGWIDRSTGWQTQINFVSQLLRCAECSGVEKHLRSNARPRTIPSV